MSALPKPSFWVYTKSVMMTFGERLRAHRESKGLGLRELARKAGIIESNLLEVEKGRRSASENILNKLASVSELDMTYEKFRAWQIMSNATPDELAHLKIELEKIQLVHDEASRTGEDS